MEKTDNLPATKENGISKQLTDEMLNPSIDLAIDYSEIYIDDLMNNEALKEIPIVKSIVGLIKGGISINQFFFAKKLLTFIREFNTGEIDPLMRLKFQEKINTDEKFRKKVSEQVMVFVDRFITVTKSKISANLFKAYVDGKISYEQFVSMNISLERLHPDSYKFLAGLEHLNYEINHEYEGERNWEAESLVLSSGLATELGDFWNGFKLNKEGKLLFELAIKPLIKKDK